MVGRSVRFRRGPCVPSGELVSRILSTLRVKDCSRNCPRYASVARCWYRRHLAVNQDLRASGVRFSPGALFPSGETGRHALARGPGRGAGSNPALESSRGERGREYKIRPQTGELVWLITLSVRLINGSLFDPGENRDVCLSGPTGRGAGLRLQISGFESREGHADSHRDLVLPSSMRLAGEGPEESLSTCLHNSADRVPGFEPGCRGFESLWRCTASAAGTGTL